MQLFSIEEIIENYNNSTVKKCKRSVIPIFFMAFTAGIMIALAGLSAVLASYAIENDSLKRLVNGLIFPFGLAIIMLLEAQLFTGNCMMVLPLLKKTVTPRMILKNWCVVYIGNFLGALVIGWAVSQLKLSEDEGFWRYLVTISLRKCQQPFLILMARGILCNVLVCTGVLLSMSAKDTTGRIMGAYIPVILFIISGFEHCVANMFYVPATLFALKSPSILEMVSTAGINATGLTWEYFIIQNLIPVTIGNILGGMLLGFLVWNYACLEKT